MSCPELSGLAGEIILDLDFPSGLSTGTVVAWLETNVGKLNVSINTEYQVVSGCIDPWLGIEEANIYKQMYLCKYYGTQVSNNLGAAAFDWSELKEGDSSIRRVSRNEIAKTYSTLSASCRETLKDMINLYKINKARPQSLSAIHDLTRYDRTSP